MISIIHPSRGRPEKSYRTISDWWMLSASGKTRGQIEVIVSCDTDDEKLSEYKRLYQNNVLVNYNGNAINAINNAAKVAKGEILMVVSDDTECPAGWDADLRMHAGGSDWIMKTKDGIQPWIITNPIMHRDYYNRFGYIYNPGYSHMFCDTELTCVADLTGRKRFADITFRHNHYSVTKEPPDVISKRADSTWDQGEKLFLERYKRNFDLPPDQIKGKIQDNGMINYLKRKLR